MVMSLLNPVGMIDFECFSLCGHIYRIALYFKALFFHGPGGCFTEVIFVDQGHYTHNYAIL